MEAGSVLLNLLENYGSENYLQSLRIADSYLDDLTLHMCRYLELGHPENKKEFIRRRLTSVMRLREKNPRLGEIASDKKNKVAQCFLKYKK